jgi:protein N-terminal amidase
MRASFSDFNAVLVQFSPTPRDIEGNIKKLENLLKDYSEKDKIDVVLFPEMALTGYIFDNREDVFPYLEQFNKGITFEFCSNLAKRLKSYVLLGYAEKWKNLETDIEELYNSCMIVDKNGNALPSYRKHFLYELDENWSLEGSDFGCMELETHSGILVKAGIGICMDINPKQFKAPWDKMEFSNHCFNNNVDIILFLTNWIDNEPELNTSKEVMRQLNYWVCRLQPYLNSRVDKPVYFLAADRCGKERDTNFIGCSCAIKIFRDLPSLLHHLDKKIESTILVTCKIRKE